MPIGHPGVGVSELLRDHGHWDALHGQPTGVGMAQDVEADGWSDLGRLAGLRDRPELVRLAPCRAVGSGEEQGSCFLAGCNLAEELDTLVG